MVIKEKQEIKWKPVYYIRAAFIEVQRNSDNYFQKVEALYVH